jgi:hypothetical protein
MNARVTPLLLLLSGCAGASGAVVNAAVNTAIAATASGVSRANGGCYAACPVGTKCNAGTGYCDPLPCNGRCRTDEACEGFGLQEHCVPRTAPLQLGPAPQ